MALLKLTFIFLTNMVHPIGAGILWTNLQDPPLAQNNVKLSQVGLINAEIILQWGFFQFSQKLINV